MLGRVGPVSYSPRLWDLVASSPRDGGAGSGEVRVNGKGKEQQGRRDYGEGPTTRRAVLEVPF